MAPFVWYVPGWWSTDWVWGGTLWFYWGDTIFGWWWYGYEVWFWWDPNPLIGTPESDYADRWWYISRGDYADEPEMQ